MLMHARAAAVAAAVGAMSIAATDATAASFKPSGMVFFGDSFIDAGAVNQFTGGAVAPAAAGFFEGRFSDGPTWADLISRRNLGNTVRTFYTGNPPGTIPGLPGFTYTPGATNFAVGGARAIGDDGMIPGLETQLALYGQYLGATGDLPDARTLFVLNFGNNDVTLLQDLAGDPAAQVDAVGTYVANMVGTAAFLAESGARHILIAGVPNPTRLPGPDLQAALDARLDMVAPAFAAAGVSLYRFDYFDFFNRLEDDPTQFGLPSTFITDQSRFCLAEVIPGPGADCSNYLLFDGIHVTEGVQRALAFEIEELVGLRGAVPEPQTWAMMILGFGVVGMAARNRRRTSTAAH